MYLQEWWTPAIWATAETSRKKVRGSNTRKDAFNLVSPDITCLVCLGICTSCRWPSIQCHISCKLGQRSLHAAMLVHQLHPQQRGLFHSCWGKLYYITTWLYHKGQLHMLKSNWKKGIQNNMWCFWHMACMAMTFKPKLLYHGTWHTAQQLKHIPLYTAFYNCLALLNPGCNSLSVIKAWTFFHYSSCSACQV